MTRTFLLVATAGNKALRADIPSKKAVEAQIAAFHAGKATPHMFETDKLYKLWDELLQIADPTQVDAHLRKIGNDKFENFETIPLVRLARHTPTRSTIRRYS